MNKMVIIRSKNPFTKDINRVIKSKPRRIGYLSEKIKVKVDGHEVEIENAGLTKDQEYESVDYMQLIGKLRYLTKTFTITELDVLFYVIDELLNYNCDCIIFNHKRVRDAMKLTNRDHTYSFMKKAIELKIFAKDETDQDDFYWINPYKLYRGNRSFLIYTKTKEENKPKDKRITLMNTIIDNINNNLPITLKDI
jgi:hypothetical protein